MTKNGSRDGVPDDISEEELDEYIDFLHDRIQFLEEELKDSEQTVLGLREALMKQEKAVKDPYGVIPISDYLDWAEDNADISQERLDRLREKLRKHDFVFSPEARRQLDSLPEDIREKTSDLRDHLEDQRSSTESAREEIEKMRENTDRFREKHGLDEDDVDESQGSDSSNSSSENGGGEKSLADKVSEYENSGGYGASPGDHI